MEIIENKRDLTKGEAKARRIVRIIAFVLMPIIFSAFLIISIFVVTQQDTIKSTDTQIQFLTTNLMGTAVMIVWSFEMYFIFNKRGAQDTTTSKTMDVLVNVANILFSIAVLRFGVKNKTINLRVLTEIANVFPSDKLFNISQNKEKVQKEGGMFGRKFRDVKGNHLDLTAEEKVQLQLILKYQVGSENNLANLSSLSSNLDLLCDAVYWEYFINPKNEAENGAYRHAIYYQKGKPPVLITRKIYWNKAINNPEQQLEALNIDVQFAKSMWDNNTLSWTDIPAKRRAVYQFVIQNHCWNRYEILNNVVSKFGCNEYSADIQRQAQQQRQTIK